MPPANKKNAILARWRETLVERGSQAAIVDANGSATRTFEDIEDEAGQLERSFGALPEGAAVGVQLGNSESWPAVVIALMRRGAVPAPLGGHLEKPELDAALETVRAAAFLELRGDSVAICELPGAEPFPDPCPDFLKLTSGTTAAPRAIRFRAEQLVTDCDNICGTMGFDGRDVSYGVIPFSHSYGFSNLILPLLCRGVAVVASHDRMPRAILAGLRGSGATVFPGMPVFFQTLVGLPGDGELGKVRLCISAGAPLPPGIAKAFTAKFGLKIHTFYGSSECGGISYDRSEEASYEEGFVGEAMEGVRLALVDSRLEIRSDAVGDGYFPESDAALRDGCFVPGDLVRRGERGLYLCGRASDVINVAGRKLNPAEVEARIAEVPGVEEVVVFGVQSALRNEEAVACVATGRSGEEMARECRARLSPWQVPKDFWIVDAIPVNERGKVNRRELAERYSTGPGDAGKR